MKFAPTLRLETKNLRIRPFVSEDLIDFYEYASTPGLGEMAGWAHHQSINKTKIILSMFINAGNVLALVDKKSDKVIGSLGLHAAQFNDDQEFANKKIAEIGYVLAKGYWGRGLMPEAVNALLEYLFMGCDYDVIACAHFTQNDQSRRVIEKVGFTYHSDDTYFAKELDKNFPERKYIINKETFISKHKK